MCEYRFANECTLVEQEAGTFSNLNLLSQPMSDIHLCESIITHLVSGRPFLIFFDGLDLLPFSSFELPQFNGAFNQNLIDNT